MGWHWGILASSGGAAGAFDLLETTVLSSSASSVTFSSLGSYSDYKHLQIRCVANTNGAGAETFRMQLNSDTGSNYAYHYLLGNGTSVSSFGEASQTRMLLGRNNNNFAATVIDIFDFSSSSKNTTIRALNGDTTGTRIYLASSFWNNTAAVTSISLFNANSVSFGSGSRFSLYGVK